MQFILNLFSEYFSIMKFSIITKIILLIFCLLYGFAIYKELKFNHKNIIYGFWAFIVGAIGFLISGFIYKYIVYTVVTFVIYNSGINIYIPYNEIGCLILLGSFMFYSYGIFSNLHEPKTKGSSSCGYRESPPSDYRREELERLNLNPDMCKYSSHEEFEEFIRLMEINQAILRYEQEERLNAEMEEQNSWNS